MSICYGITSFNRIDLLTNLLKKLIREIHSNDQILVLDDSSYDFDINYIITLLKDHPQSTVISNTTNLGPDINMYRMFQEFLRLESRYLLICDADLDICDNISDRIRELPISEDYIISLYNSSVHESLEERKIVGIDFAVKQHVGAAGTLLTREQVNEIVMYIEPSDHFDWKWSEYFRIKGIRKFVVKRSLVQHLGVDGVHNYRNKEIDFGLGFHAQNEQAIYKVFENVSIRYNEIITILNRNPFVRFYRFFWKVLGKIQKVFGLSQVP